jgi:hypothetical protein
MKRLNLIGKRYGRLTVLEQFRDVAPGDSKVTSRSLCLCDCGNTVTVLTANLRRGNTTSCGCYNHELTTKHGLWDHPLYATWNGIISRCTNPNHTSYPRYGALGITVCERWRADPAAFIEDMGPRPSPGHSVDRIDPNGSYSPENCRWATSTEQQRNRRDTRIITIGDKTKCLADWLDTLHMHDSTFFSRLSRGMSEADALTKPVQYHRPRMR